MPTSAENANLLRGAGFFSRKISIFCIVLHDLECFLTLNYLREIPFDDLENFFRFIARISRHVFQKSGGIYRPHRPPVAETDCGHVHENRTIYIPTQTHTYT